MIPHVIFKFDSEKDLKNIWDACNAKAMYGHNWKNSVTSNIYKICHGKEYSKCRKELKKTMNYIYNNKITFLTADLFSKAWKKIEKKYFERLKKLMGLFCSKEVIAYLTTAGRCPYNPNKNHPSFYAHLFGGVFSELNTAGHELMHIQFHNSKYWKICEKELGKEKTSDLKEALTVLLNLEFQDLWASEDKGYPNHIKLREFIAKQWRKKKDFDILINNSIQWIKKNGIK